MIFDQRPELQRARALRRIHHQASGYTERQAAQDRVTNELNAWQAMRSNESLRALATNSRASGYVMDL